MIHAQCGKYESIQPCNMKNKDIYWRRYKMQETLYIGQWCLSLLRSYDLFEEIWFISRGSNQVISSCSMMFCSGSKSCRTNLAMTRFMPRSCVKISDTVVLESPDQLQVLVLSVADPLVIAACTYSTFLGVVLVAGLPQCGSLSIDSLPSLKHLCHTLICPVLTVSSPKAFWIIWIVSAEECSNLMQSLMQIHCCTHSVILNAMAT